MTSARQEISAIDKLIDANRRGANDKLLECDLFRQRGLAQLRRGTADDEASMATARSMRLRRQKCPTCGHRSLAA